MNLFECTTVVELERAIVNGADLEQLTPPWNNSLGSNNPWYAEMLQGPGSSKTPLMLFVSHKRHDLVMCLLNHGAKVDRATFNHIAEQGWVDALKLCNPLGRCLDSALYIACKQGYCDVVDYILSISRPSNYTSEYVCMNNKVDLFDLFIKHHVPLNFNMIKSACKGGSIDILNRLYIHCPDFHSHVSANILQCLGYNAHADQWLEDHKFNSF